MTGKRRAGVLSSAVVVLVALTVATATVLLVDPEPPGFRRALFWWVLLLVLMIGVPVGADLADRADQRGRLRITVRYVPGSRGDQR